MGLFVVVAAALAYPNGYTGECNTAGPTVPSHFPRGLRAPRPVIACAGLFCNVTADVAFKGFVVGVSAGKIVPNPSDAWPYHSDKCITHRSNGPKTAVSFELTEGATVHAVVVYSKPGAAHYYNLAASVAAFTQPKRIVIAGAGPGGVAAGRYAAHLGHTAVVYERGPLVEYLFGRAAHVSYLHTLKATRSPLLFNPLNSSDDANHLLGSMVGGTQNINGAVAAPGRAADLARSTGVSVAAAVAAQAIVKDYVNTVPAIAPAGLDVALMLQCPGGGACDSSFVAGASQLHRRSVATGVAGIDNLELHANTEVKHIEPGGVVALANGTKIAGDFVVLAAGALASPQLLNKTRFEGYNHYYKAEYVNTTPPTGADTTTQVFEYAGDTEINYAKVILPHAPQTPVWIKITMLMTPTARETHTVGQAYGNNVPQRVLDLGYTAQAWHFMGTVPHTAMKAADGVYLGDASALRTPFNCHTSMPAAAAGVLAVQAGLGILPIDPPEDQAAALQGNFKVFTWLFLAGGFAAAVGVLVHAGGAARGSPAAMQLHYVLMPLAAAVITAGAFAAMQHKGSGGTKSLMKNGHHRWLGWVTVGMILLQTYAGIAIRKWDPKERPLKASLIHRSMGIVTLLLLAAMVWSGVHPHSPAHMFDGIDPRVAPGYAAVALLLLAAVVALANLVALVRRAQALKRRRASELKNAFPLLVPT